MAINHFRLKILRICFINWQSWAREQQRLKDIKHQKEINAMRMAAFLDAAASGKLWNGNDTKQSTTLTEVEERSAEQSSSRTENVDKKIVWLFISNYLDF